MAGSSENYQNSEDSISTNEYCQNSEDLSKTTSIDDFVESVPRTSSMPHEGMSFQSDEEAYKFYNNFALINGFAIRRYSTYKSRNSDIIVRRTFVCNREGFKKKQDTDNERDVKRRRESRCGCKAYMEIVLNKCGLWEIKKYSNNHSHELLKSPNKKRKLRSHNKYHKESTCKKLIEQYHSCGFGPAKISRAINSANDSATDVVTPRQCSDYLRIKRKNNIGNECMIVIQSFLERKARDSEFYYAIQLDDTQSCRSIFWCDARARRSYMKFHDVIVFDVTYKTNNFSMPFAPFTGVNHHRQSILFGCALLSDEKEDTFVWLFEQWLNCMWNQPPGAIITDQDPAICNAIARIFPHTHHRYCKWHLGLHECEHLRSLQCAHPTFNEDYNKWAKKSQTIEDSEESWINLRDKYKPNFEEPSTEPQKNMIKSWRWVEKMYEKRQHWVKAYLKDTFFAGMKSSQRSESMNSYFDGYVNSNTPLSEFIEQYENAITNRRNTEDSEDLVSMTTTPDFTDMHSLEAHAGRVYCRNIFKIFQVEFSKILHCQHKKKIVKEDGEISYEVDFKELGKSHIVDVNATTQFCKCSCAKFETWGIPCKHILYIMKQKLRLKTIPDLYILPRWTLSVRYKTTSDVFEEKGGEAGTNETENSKEITALEAWTLRGEMNRLYEKCISQRDLYATVEKVMQECWKKIDEIEKIKQSSILPQNKDMFTGRNNTEEGSQASLLNFIVRDPNKCKTKGRPRNASRIPTGMQESQDLNLKRKCSSCGQKGHYRSTCKSNI